MNQYLLPGLFIIILIIGLILALKHSRAKSIDEDWPYPVSGSDEIAARQLQQGYLPSSDDLEETGGLYMIENGIQSPSVSPKDNPRLDQESHLGT